MLRTRAHAVGEPKVEPLVICGALCYVLEHGHTTGATTEQKDKLGGWIS